MFFRCGIQRLRHDLQAPGCLPPALSLLCSNPNEDWVCQSWPGSPQLSEFPMHSHPPVASAADPQIHNLTEVFSSIPDPAPSSLRLGASPGLSSMLGRVLLGMDSPGSHWCLDSASVSYGQAHLASPARITPELALQGLVSSLGCPPRLNKQPRVPTRLVP